jgi:NADPH:quinone reductase
MYTYSAKANKANEQAAVLVQWLSEGKISPVVARVLPLSQASEAHRLLEQTRPVGKIVLEP